MSFYGKQFLQDFPGFFHDHGNPEQGSCPVKAHSQEGSQKSLFEIFPCFFLHVAFAFLAHNFT